MDSIKSELLSNEEVQALLAANKAVLLFKCPDNNYCGGNIWYCYTEGTGCNCCDLMMTDDGDTITMGPYDCHKVIAGRAEDAIAFLEEHMAPKKAG